MCDQNPNPVKLTIEQIKQRFAGTEPISTRRLQKLKSDPRLGARRIYELLRKRCEADRQERRRIARMLRLERALWNSGVSRVAGVDEVGVGPLAGPVVAAAVVFPPGAEVLGIDDSKRLDPDNRVRLADQVRAAAAGIGIGAATVDEIESLNIYRASLLAMRRAIEALPLAPQHVLFDARLLPDLPVLQNSFHGGDRLVFSVAAASIIAKTHRDRLMVELEERFPGYGLARHKGYATAEHQRAIRLLGPSPIHRRSFLHDLCGEFSPLFYAFKSQMAQAASALALSEVEVEIRTAWTSLEEKERRKLRSLLSRRRQFLR
jgi:ribonuclease HII